MSIRNFQIYNTVTFLASSYFLSQFKHQYLYNFRTDQSFLLL